MTLTTLEIQECKNIKKLSLKYYLFSLEPVFLLHFSIQNTYFLCVYSNVFCRQQLHFTPNEKRAIVICPLTMNFSDEVFLFYKQKKGSSEILYCSMNQVFYSTLAKLWCSRHSYTLSCLPKSQCRTTISQSSLHYQVNILY